MADINYHFFPSTESPPEFVGQIVTAFESHLSTISTVDLDKGLTSDVVLATVRPDLIGLGFDVESGKARAQKIERPVFYGPHHPNILTYIPSDLVTTEDSDDNRGSLAAYMGRSMRVWDTFASKPLYTHTAS